MNNGTNIIPLRMQRLIGSCVGSRKRENLATDWQPIEAAPFGRDLRLSVIENDQVHALVFPCLRTASGWLNALNNRSVPVRPTHWRLWTEAPHDVRSAARAGDGAGRRIVIIT